MTRRSSWLLGALAATGVLTAPAALAEAAWVAGHPQLADLISVSRLLLCWLCVATAWKALRAEALRPAWAHAGRAALAAFFVVALLT